ncbi:MAG: hydroxymethylbilane synthase [Xanthomonadales bacterium]|nr:hydroxymethylbilane synthase [Xanthomonadales bacterium]MBK7146823.1 hydroxymethylbilane synthase [Xanthomonadales bacterium]MCC6561544.1 hydroxymethylbilane synthase [Xanthomonadales bacterium]
MVGRLRIATRKSPLALWQTEHVAQRLRQAHPGLRVELLPLSTRGDVVLDRSLAAIGGKGLFLKELEEAMQEGRADLAVHSLKDVPMQLDPGFALAAILARANPYDAFVSNRFAEFDELPQRAVIGTSSLRRHAQIRALRPDLQVRDLRGNVNTRLAKLDGGEYDAIVLACAGLERLGFHDRIRAQLMPPRFLPAVAQGAIAIEVREGDAAVGALCGVLHDVETGLRVRAERAMNLELHGSCQVPIAGFATLVDGQLHLRALVGDTVTGEILRAEASAAADDPERLGRSVAAQLRALGADRLLHAAH